jgi:hypothetical protein
MIIAMTTNAISSDGTIEIDVIAALRLALEGTTDWEQFGQVANAILECAPDTPDNNYGGVRLLVKLHQEDKLQFELRGDS